ncbi:GNAT family N-acetyltransferase [Undibacterium sp. Ji50W]|uniref:GNAT family N-acetyltransferase n=1 Tax=Undibacterium sp. Ji50W TaxID=3413041 RepID=UPI003BF24BE8
MKKIIAPGICLRAFETQDAEQFTATVLESVPTVGRWMSWCHAGFTIEATHEWFEVCKLGRTEGTAYEFGIFTEDGKELLGACGLNLISKMHNYCNLGYWIRQSKQGQGIATRVARILVEAGFKQLGFNRIEIVVAEGNELSMQVARKLGALHECTARNRLMVGGLPAAASIYSLVPQEWPALPYQIIIES